jgi:hypothetical protein
MPPNCYNWIQGRVPSADRYVFGEGGELKGFGPPSFWGPPFFLKRYWIKESRHGPELDLITKLASPCCQGFQNHFK